DAVGVRHALRSLGLLRWHQGRDEDALACIEEALAIDRERGDAVAVVGDLSNLGYVLKGMGYFESAEERLLEGIDLSERILAGDSDASAKGEAAVKQHYLVHNLANVYRQLGQSDRALELMRRATERAGGERLPIQLSYHYTSIAHLCLVAGRIEESLEHYRAAIDFTRRANFVPGLSLSLRMLGEVLSTLGRRAEALPLLEEAAHLFAQLGTGPARPSSGRISRGCTRPSTAIRRRCRRGAAHACSGAKSTTSPASSRPPKAWAASRGGTSPRRRWPCRTTTMRRRWRRR